MKAGQVAVDRRRRQGLLAMVGLGLNALVVRPDHATAGELRPAADGPALGDAVRWPGVRLLDQEPGHAGARIDAAQLRDTAWVLVFFATDCPYCQRHNHHVQKLLRASRGQPLRVLGAALDHDPQIVRAYLQQQGFSFPVTMDAAPLRAALTRRQGVPLTVVVDRGGRLREVIPGEMFEEDVLALAHWAQPG